MDDAQPGARSAVLLASDPSQRDNGGSSPSYPETQRGFRMAADATQLLTRIADGDQLAVDRLLPSVYEELRARALVHEAYLKLIDQRAAR